MRTHDEPCTSLQAANQQATPYAVISFDMQLQKMCIWQNAPATQDGMLAHVCRAVHTTPVIHSPADMLYSVITNLLADTHLPETSWSEDAVESSWEGTPSVALG